MCWARLWERRGLGCNNYYKEWMLVFCMKIDWEMHLNERNFFKIKRGEKIFEARLFDEKRSMIKVGDVIRFHLRDAGDFFDAGVVGLNKYDSFAEMFFDLGPEVFGCSNDYCEENFVFNCRKFYSEEDEKRFGVLGIRLEVLK